MASEIDIANLALSHIGDIASVSSFDEQSAQAVHCARFYPVARDALLEMHPWGFATRRIQLAQLGNPWPEWGYCYAQPANVLNILAVLPPDAADDYSASGAGRYSPQPFSCEADELGNQVIYTDQASAVLRYTSAVTDTTVFSPLFTVALSWHLAAMIAGPIIKGDAGAAEAKRCAGMVQAYLSKATESDANQRKGKPGPIVPWIQER